MPWRQANTVSDLRRSFLLDHAAGVPLDALLVTYGIKKTAAYELLRRARESSIDAAVAVRSRAPHKRPTKLPAKVVERVLQLRTEYSWGARKLARLYVENFREPSPSPSSIGNILKAHGHTRPCKRRRAPVSTQPLAEAKEPNDVWAVDHKGRMAKLGLEPLTVLDVASRYWLACEPLADKSYEATREVFERLFADLGLPRVIRVDAGGPWSSAYSPLRLTRLSAWWVSLGIEVEIVRSCQENGHVERLHGTIEREVDASDVVDVRDHFEHHRRLYNEVRPHDALDMATPDSRYTPSPRSIVDVRPVDKQRWDQVRTVTNAGYIYWRGTQVFVTEALVGEKVGLRQQTMTTWSVHFHHLVIGSLDDTGFQPTRR
jgi:putative transposase